MEQECAPMNEDDVGYDVEQECAPMNEDDASRRCTVCTSQRLYSGEAFNIVILNILIVYKPNDRILCLGPRISALGSWLSGLFFEFNV